VPPVLNGHRSAVTALAFSPTHEDVLVSGGGDAVLQVWRLRDDNSAACEPTAMSNHTHPVIGVDFHPGVGEVLVSCSMDSTVRCGVRAHVLTPKSVHVAMLSCPPPLLSHRGVAVAQAVGCQRRLTAC
jgi:WD40 repeat protein